LRLLRPASHDARDLRAGLLARFIPGTCPAPISRHSFARVLALESRQISRRRSQSRAHCGTNGPGETILVHSEGIRDRHAPARRRFERGAGKLKAVIYLAILVFIIYSAVKIVPIYVSNYQLSDKMQEEARFAVVNRRTEEQIRDNIFKVVQELEIPVKRETIMVTASNSIVKISMEYTVPVDLLFYHMDLHFSPSSENKSVI